MKLFLKIFFTLILIGAISFAAYYYLVIQKNPEEEIDPLYCETDEECTYYNVFNCINSKPINKASKGVLLKAVENNTESLCGEIQTACKKNECIIVK